ncbi:MAG: DUF1931 domain-containing protein [Candidatus Woesearchaeota archaeon]|nr:DUF1931 domain-containing protein [Candidatus Woesearchaeota archaeon]
MGEIIIKSRVKDFAKIDNQEFSVSGDFSDALAKKVEEIIRESCIRARENSRRTVMARDL